MIEPHAPAAPAENDEELNALIETLHETERRVEALTAGQIDSVTDRGGRTLLLRNAQDRMRQSDAEKQAALLNALPARVAILDIHGAIVSMNEAWQDDADYHVLQGPDYRVGQNYVQRCEQAEGADEREAHRVAAGILDVIEGRRNVFSIEYEVGSIDRRSYLLTVSPLDDNRLDGVVVMHVDISDLRRKEHALLRFAGAMEAIADAVFLVDRASMRIVHVNEAACRLQRTTREELLASPPWDVLHLTRDELEETYDAIIASGVDARPLEVQIHREDEMPMWVEVRRHAERSDDSWTIVTLLRDITESRADADRVMKLSRVHAMLGGINSLAVRVRDRDELFRESCRISIRAGGFLMAWIAVLKNDELRMAAIASHSTLEPFVARLGSLLQTHGDEVMQGTLTAEALRSQLAAVSNETANDPSVQLHEEQARAGIHSLAIMPIVVGGENVGVFALCSGKSDFFQREELKLLAELADNIAFAIDHLNKQERLHYLAYYDVLTGLANRSLFLERVGQYMRTAVAGDHELALVFVDLERFKSINDSLGQAAGDTILCQVADWLSTNAGGSELMARLGADHFALVIPRVRPDGDLARLIEQVMARFQHQPFRFEESVIRMSMRIGVALFPDDGASADAVFRNAEAALKKAKLGGDAYLFYTPSMSETNSTRLTLENKLRLALDNEEFVLHYQPKLSLVTGLVIGCEGLIRWHDPANGLVAPGRFIPILEETGLIRPIGRWAMNKAVEDYLRWLNTGLRAVPIAVNVSPLQLRNRGFAVEVTRAVSVDARAPAGLELEITESVIVEDVKHNVACLNAIRALGIRVAIDDFGTGFSSLSYLSHLPVDTLKIDRSFVDDLTGTVEGQALVSTIISLAHALRLNVVAEGVELHEQKRLLQLLHCDEMQGYLFSPPVPCDVFEAKFLQQTH